jgi:hypothetical protein
MVDGLTLRCHQKSNQSQSRRVHLRARHLTNGDKGDSPFEELGGSAQLHSRGGEAA